MLTPEFYLKMTVNVNMEGLKLKCNRMAIIITIIYMVGL